MTEGVLYLDGYDGTPRNRAMFRWTQFTFGCLFLVQSIFSENEILWFVLFQGAYGLGLIVTMAFFPWFLKPKTLQFNEQGLKVRLSRGRPISLDWSEVVSMEASMFRFVVKTKDDRTIPINLGALSYEQHKRVKPQFLEIARSRGVEVKSVES
jgi:hypothetical protein